LLLDTTKLINRLTVTADAESNDEAQHLSRLAASASATLALQELQPVVSFFIVLLPVVSRRAASKITALGIAK
jgi:hypothetical protein